MKKVIFVAFLGAVSLQAQAGLWDSISSLWSDDEETTTQVTEQAAPAAKTAAVTKTSSLMETGLQLLPMLTQTLGVSSGQAEGGMGAILQAAQSLLSGTDFSTLAQAIPNMDSLLAAAPAIKAAGTSESGGLLDSAMGAVAEYSETAKAGSQLLSQFKSLGLSADMIPKFTDVASDYLEQGDTPEAANLLSSALSGIIK